jgi:CDP-4-dehydro-6-deoxyglucose reductase
MLSARLVEFRELAPSVRHFVFEVPGVETLTFQTGQFVSLSHLIGERKITRAYSIASVPNGNRFELCLNRVDDGIFSPHLFSMQPGDAVSMKGLLGTFVWRQPVKPSILVATGTGIAPFRGMLLEELARGDGPPVTLIFGVRYAPHLLYRAEFEAMAASHPRFSFWPTVTRPDESWTGRSGRVQGHLIEALGGSTGFDVYVCGLKEMVDDVRARLKDLGFDRKQIIAEKYD